MKKVLIITYYWPPSGGAGVQRWLKFTKYLPEYGWEPIIYTPENPEAPVDDYSLFNDIRKDLKILKQPIFEPYSAYKRFLGHNQEQRVNAGFLSESKKNSAKEKIAVWIRGNFFIPDARKFWIRPSVRFLSGYLKENPVDAIISTGPPHSMHLIALKLKKKFNIPWISDFRDPWTGIDFYKDLNTTRWADFRHKQLEKKTLKNSDVIIAIGKNLSIELEKLGGRNVKIITNGYDDSEFNSESKPQSDIFTITHVGAINKDRDHSVFWKCFSEINEQNLFGGTEWKIKIIGKFDYSGIEKIKKYNLENRVEIIPYIPHNETIEIEKSSSVLYLPINNTPNAKGILTGKLYEYLASGRPILAIGPEDGDVAEILKDTNSGVISDFNDLNMLKKHIIDYFEHFKDGTLNRKITNIEKYSRKSLTKSLSEILNEVTA